MKHLSDFNEYKQEFKDTFGVELYHFYGIFARLYGAADFDVMKFDDWLHIAKGYKEEKDGSMKDFIEKHYGDKAVKLIKKLIDL